MRSYTLPACILSLCLTSATSALGLQARQVAGLVEGDGYYQPSSNGGQMITFVDGTYPPGLGEPINIIVSSDSDPRVLGEAREAWFASLGFSSNCLGQWPENQHRANLGDGNGPRNQSEMKRWNYGDYNFGSCRQTIEGGNHFRYWIQSGPEAPSGALFLAASVEDDLDNGHRISEPSGYDAGRDETIGNATQTSGTSAFGYRFMATASMVSGLLQPGSEGINHGIPIDGNVSVVTVQIVESGLPITYSGAHPSSTIPYLLSVAAATLVTALVGSTAYLLV